MATWKNQFAEWVESVHAPLGRWAPLSASVLFAASRFAPNTFLRVLAYSGATVMALLVALDVARSMLDQDSPGMEKMRSRRRRYVPVNPWQFVLAALLTALYTFLIFIGMGPFTPFIFVPFIAAFASIAAWRNVRHWYEQGAEYEEEREEMDHYLEERIIHSREGEKR